MLTEILSAETLQGGVSFMESARLGLADAVRQGPHQQYSGDIEMIAGLQLTRSFARLFIMLAVASSFLFVGYGAFLLMAAGGEARRIERAMEVFKNVGIGLVVAVGSYLIVSIAIVFLVRNIGAAETVSYWDESVFQDDFGFHRLIDPADYRDYAMQGEVFVLDGLTPIVCEHPLPAEATSRGWIETTITPAGSATSFQVCVRN